MWQFMLTDMHIFLTASGQGLGRLQPCHRMWLLICTSQEQIEYMYTHTRFIRVSYRLWSG